MAALNTRSNREDEFSPFAAVALTLELFEGMLWVDRSTLGVDVGGQRARGGGQGPLRATYKDRGGDREGGHGSTSQLNLTISLPRESALCHFCPPFRDALNQLAGQTRCDLAIPPWDELRGWESVANGIP